MMTDDTHDNALPVIDIAPLVAGDAGMMRVAAALDAACRTDGFFYVVGHGVDEELARRLERLSRAFFALDEEEKMRIAMRYGGRAWRGYFPVGAELTSQRPDLKEGLYFGTELPADDPSVSAGTPMHGPNLFPAIDGFRETVLAYIDALTRLGATLMSGLALGLGLPATYFHERYTRDPLVLFRIFHYPARPALADADGESWGVGEHTDYGLLTVLRQDDVGGLEVKSGGAWRAAPPIPGSFICNIGDMLDRMTGGLYRSTPHRVRASRDRDRLSLPFFFDPAYTAEVRPIDLGTAPQPDDRGTRWDGESVHAFSGTYGEYLLRKVGRVFPELADE